MQQAARDTLETAVGELRHLQDDAASPGHHRADRVFRQILDLLTPRMRQLTRRYALDDMPDDAAQACAIGIHRAIATYDPEKASFSTHATWAMRGELQSLRHRVRLDQRDSAKAAGIRTIGIEASGYPADADGEVLQIPDEGAREAAERGASDHLAALWLTRLKATALETLSASPKAATFPQDTAAAVSYWMSGPTGSRQERERQRQNARRIGRYFLAGATAMATAS